MPKIDISGSPVINSVKMAEQGSNPATPAAGYSAVFMKADGLYVIDDGGNVTGPLVASATGGSGFTTGAHVYKASDMNVENITETPIAFDNERYDTDAIHDNSTENTKLICKTAGKYLIHGQVQWDTNASNTRYLYIRLGGTTYIGQSVHAAVASLVQEVTTIWSLGVNDYVELTAYHDSGSQRQVKYVSGGRSPEFMMQRIG